jgi:hypothetical protein
MASFPDFRPLALEDRDRIQKHLWGYQPDTSELTFTNLFIWRALYRWQWSAAGEWLLLLQDKDGEEPWFLPPVGPPSRVAVTRTALRWLRAERGVRRPRIERADSRLVSELGSLSEFEVTPEREHFDYIYRSSDLIALKGSRYHAKRNHINRFLDEHDDIPYEAVPIGRENISLCVEFQERWCQVRRCQDDMNLLQEWTAIREALAAYGDLGVRGEAILIGDKVEGFTFGELLNAQTAVVHVEKANPEVRGLYALINRHFCQEYWSDVAFINREQDLGEPGLRKAKLSYHPVNLVEKYRLELAG